MNVGYLPKDIFTHGLEIIIILVELEDMIFHYEFIDKLIIWKMEKHNNK
jgi:hypothetical protein